MTNPSVQTMLLPVQILCAANADNGGLIKFPSGREIILGKADAVALRATPSTAAVDITNHHNALNCPYCNPQGLSFASTIAGEAVEFDNNTTDWRKIAPELDTVYSELCSRLKGLDVDGLMEYIARVFRQKNHPSSRPNRREINR